MGTWGWEGQAGRQGRVTRRDVRGSAEAPQPRLFLPSPGSGVVTEQHQPLRDTPALGTPTGTQGHVPNSQRRGTLLTEL